MKQRLTWTRSHHKITSTVVIVRFCKNVSTRIIWRRKKKNKKPQIVLSQKSSIIQLKVSLRYLIVRLLTWLPQQWLLLLCVFLILPAFQGEKWFTLKYTCKYIKKKYLHTSVPWSAINWYITCLVLLPNRSSLSFLEDFWISF